VVAASFTFEDGVSGKDRRDLAAFLDETASRALSGGGDPDDLAAAFLRVLAKRLDDPGPVTIKLGQLDEAKRLVVRRLLYSARERAAAGDGSRIVAGALLALLTAWESCIGYDPQQWYEGPRNLWGEPANLSRTRGLGAVGEPIVR
jgi:hypothetical protein